MSSTYEKLKRLKIRLQAGPATAQELCASTGANLRTLYRHLEALEAEGCGLRKVKGEGKVRRYYLEPEVPTVPPVLLQGLRKMQKELVQGGNHRHAKLVPAVLQYLEPGAPAGLVPEAITLDAAFALDHGPLSEYDSSSDKVEKLLTAIHRGQTLALQYAHRDGGVERFEFQPCRVVLRVGRLYLLGSRVGKVTVESLVVSRIKMMTTTPVFFPVPELDVTEYYKHCFGQWVPRQKGVKPLSLVLYSKESWVRLLFAESHFNPPAKVRPEGEGCRVELKLYDTPDLRKWLLSLLPEVQVLEPSDLRAELKATAQQIVKSLG